MSALQACACGERSDWRRRCATNEQWMSTIGSPIDNAGMPLPPGLTQAECERRVEEAMHAIRSGMPLHDLALQRKGDLKAALLWFQSASEDLSDAMEGLAEGSASQAAKQAEVLLAGLRERLALIGMAMRSGQAGSTLAPHEINSLLIRPAFRTRLIGAASAACGHAPLTSSETMSAVTRMPSLTPRWSVQRAREALCRQYPIARLILRRLDTRQHALLPTLMLSDLRYQHWLEPVAAAAAAATRALMAAHSGGSGSSSSPRPLVVAAGGGLGVSAAACATAGADCLVLEPNTHARAAVIAVAVDSAREARQSDAARGAGALRGLDVAPDDEAQLAARVRPLLPAGGCDLLLLDGLLAPDLLSRRLLPTASACLSTICTAAPSSSSIATTSSSGASSARPTIVLPRRASIVAALAVQLTGTDETGGVDLEALESCRWCPHTVPLPLRSRRSNGLQLVSEPVALFHFDLAEAAALAGSGCEEVAFRRLHSTATPPAAGAAPTTVNAVAFWLRLDLGGWGDDIDGDPRAEGNADSPIAVQFLEPFPAWAALGKEEGVAVVRMRALHNGLRVWCERPAGSPLPPANWGRWSCNPWHFGMGEDSLSEAEELRNTFRTRTSLSPHATPPAHQPAADGPCFLARRPLDGLLPHLSTVRDRRRNGMYRRAIEAAIRRAKHRGGGEAAVLEIGAGAGLLCAYASRAGADKVIGCELEPSLARVARRTMLRNGLQSKASIFELNAFEMSEQLPRSARFDVITAELMDSNGLGERMIPLMHLAAVVRARAPCVMVPRRLRVWALPLELREVLAPCSGLESPGVVVGVQLRAWLRWRPTEGSADLKRSEYRALSAPFLVCDTEMGNAADARVAAARRLRVRCTADGTANAVAMYWHVEMSAEEDFTNAPGAEDTCWSHGLDVIRPRRCRAGEELLLGCNPRCVAFDFADRLGEDARSAPIEQASEPPPTSSAALVGGCEPAEAPADDDDDGAGAPGSLGTRPGDWEGLCDPEPGWAAEHKTHGRALSLDDIAREAAQSGLVRPEALHKLEGMLYDALLIVAAQPALLGLHPAVVFTAFPTGCGSR